MALAAAEGGEYETRSAASVRCRLVVSSEAPVTSALVPVVPVRLRQLHPRPLAPPLVPAVEAQVRGATLHLDFLRNRSLDRWDLAGIMVLASAHAFDHTALRPHGLHVAKGLGKTTELAWALLVGAASLLGQLTPGRLYLMAFGNHRGTRRYCCRLRFN